MSPLDDLGSSWVRGVWDDPKMSRMLEGMIGTLITTDEDGRLEILGSAFVICAQGKAAICLCAAHSFEPVKQRQLRRSGRHYLNVPKDFLPVGPQFFSSNGIFLFLVVEGEVVICRIHEQMYIDGYDVATFIAEAVEDVSPFRHGAAIDLAMPAIGDDVAIVAHHLSIGDYFDDDRGSVAVVKRGLDLRAGTVIAVDLEGSESLGQKAVFKTSIPVTPGMSGAPVIILPTPGRTLTAIGVVSSDISKEESFGSFLIAGHSNMSMLWPAMGLLGAPIKMPEEPGRFAFLGEMLGRGALNNQTDRRVAVSTRHADDETQILYDDQRTGTPTRCLFTNQQPHPRRAGSLGP